MYGVKNPDSKTPRFLILNLWAIMMLVGFNSPLVAEAPFNLGGITLLLEYSARPNAGDQLESLDV